MDWTSSSDPYVVAPAPGEPDAWTTQTGGRGGQRILEAGVFPAAEEVRAALGLQPGEQVVTRSRLILLDDAPIERVVSHWPASWAASTGLAMPRPAKGGTMRLLADLGRTAAARADEVDAVEAGPDLADWVPAGAPVLLIARTLFGADGQPFEYCVMHRWNGQRQRYVERAV